MLAVTIDNVPLANNTTEDKNEDDDDDDGDDDGDGDDHDDHDDPYRRTSITENTVTGDTKPLEHPLIMNPSIQPYYELLNINLVNPIYSPYLSILSINPDP